MSLALFGQQDAQFTQYMYNTIHVNPAYAGSREVISIFGLYRNQWLGIDGAPITATASINGPINNSNIGLGLSFMNDKIGPLTDSSISADISYFFRTSKNFKLAFGVKATANLLNIDFTQLNIYNAEDLTIQNNIDHEFSPNIGAGLYLYSNRSYLGLSIPNFFETKHFDESISNSNSVFLAKERLHYYLIGGHVFDLNPNLKFKPAFLTKIVQGAPLQLDVSANILIQEKLNLGLAYRFNAALSALLGFQVNQSWFVGYAYDFDTTNIGNYNSGSHEIFLWYEFFNHFDRIVSPRFF